MCASYSSHANISLVIDQSGCPHFCLLCIRGSRGAQYVAILRRNIADGRLDQFWQESLLFNDSQAISSTVIPLNRGHCRPFQRWPPVGVPARTEPVKISESRLRHSYAPCSPQYEVQKCFITACVTITKGTKVRCTQVRERGKHPSNIPVYTPFALT
jgi:hypothetical protein